MFDIGFIGFGNIAQALAKGLSSSKYNICAYDVLKSKAKIIEALNADFLSSSEEVVEKSKIIIICVKPSHFPEVLENISSHISKKKIIVSVGAGVSLSFISKFLKERKLVRIMPNLSSAFGNGFTAVAFNKLLLKKERGLITKILDSFGKTIELKNESLFDNITALSGSGPAFFAFYLDSIIKYATDSGFTKKQAVDIAYNTSGGALSYLKNSNILPKKFIELVSSPKGTTEEGIKYLKFKGFEKIIMDCHKKSAKKAKAISLKNEVLSRRKKK
jgi:pyrroline-5-carboxylate reductase